MDKVRIGVIGLRFGQHLVRTLANMPGVKLAAVADRSSHFVEGLDAYAAGVGAKAYIAGMSMIEQEALDAVVLAISPKHRASLIEAAARRGLPMFVEKPWAVNTAHARQLADLCERLNATVMLGFSFRFLPAIIRLKTLLTADLGDPWILNGNYIFAWIPPADSWLWNSENGGGFFNENSGHLFDAVCYLMGQPVSVMAEASNFTGSPSEDAACVTLRFENGGIAALTIGGVGTKAIKNYPYINLFTANGQAQLIGHEHIWDSLTWTTHDASTKQTFAAAPESLGSTRYTTAMQHFVECVRSGAKPTATVEDGILAVTLAEAIYESARTGKKVLLK